MADSSNEDLTLSPAQAAAVASDDRGIIVVASAGSGKTEVVARRVQRLLTEAADLDGRILALTYTVKASDELRNRLSSRLGRAARLVDTETIHGFAHSLLRQHGTNIGLPVEPELLRRDEDRAELFGRWFEDNRVTTPDDVAALLRTIDLARSRGEATEFLEAWELALEGAGALDYPGLLTAATRLLGLHSTRRRLARLYDHVIVDEAQNLTPAQYELLVALVGDADGSLAIPTMLVGDDKQSIVSFAGADPGLMDRFASQFHATRFNLDANFRSAREISKVAEAVATQLGHANPVGVFAAKGEVTRYDAPNEVAEAEYVAVWIAKLLTEGLDQSVLAEDEPTLVRPEEIAVLGRSGVGLRNVTKALQELGIATAVASITADWLSSLPGRIVLEIVSLRTAPDHQSTHWQLARLLDADESLVSDLNLLKDKLQSNSDPSLAMLAPLCDIEDVAGFIAALGSITLPATAPPSELAAWQSDLVLLQDTWHRFDEEVERAAVTWGNFRLYCARQQRGDDLAPGVRVLTIHKAQGREFRAVAIIGMNDGQFPDFRATSDEERLAELRTFYVAVSRARRSLLLTRPRSRETRFGSRASSPSSFLQFLGS